MSPLSTGPVMWAESRWLWGVLLSIAGYFVLARLAASRRARFAKFAEPAVWQAIAPELDFSARTRKARAMAVALVFFFLALARPQWGAKEEIVTVSGLDIILALDVSTSMAVEDVTPNRLRKAQHVVRTLVDRLRGDRVGIVAFAGSAYLACPLTSDLEYALDVLQLTGPQSITNQGTDIAVGLETAAKAMERGAEGAAAGTPGASGSPTRVVVLISDGEDHQERALEGARALQAAGVKLYVLGVGTQKGGPVPVRDESGALQGYKKDRKGEPVVSAFRPDALMAVASAAGGRYWNITPSETEVDELLDDLGGLQRSDFQERRVVTYEDRYQYPLFLGLLFLFLELSLAARKISDGSRRRRAAAVLAIAGWLLVPRAEAAPVESYLENKKGLEAFTNGELDSAKQSFGAAQALDPERPELEFNQGVVKNKQGDADGAAQSFGMAAKMAQEQKNSAVAGKAFYNLGGVLGSKGDFKGAVESYLHALEESRRSGDKQLEADTRKNLELLVRKQEQQQQQKKQNKEKKDGEQDPNKDKDQGSDQNQPKDNQQDQNKDQKGKDDKDKDKDKKDQQGKEEQQPKNYKDPSKDRKREFKSEKMSPEDAERVMSELQARERELQGKLKRQRGQPTRQEKDW